MNTKKYLLHLSKIKSYPMRTNKQTYKASVHYTCADCFIQDPSDNPTFTSYIRLEDAFYYSTPAPGSNNTDGSGYWDIGVSGSSGSFLLVNDLLGSNTFRIDGQGVVNMSNISLTDQLGNGDQYLKTEAVGAAHKFQLQKDFTFLSFSDDDTSNQHGNGVWAIEYSPLAEGLNFWKPWPNNTGYGNYYLFLANDGNIGVGTSTPPYKLSVEGTIGAREIIVETDTWSDYVFSPDYELMPLEEVKEFTLYNCHLPGVPSEGVILENGINVGEMNILLLEKVEELTLYLIEQDETVKKQQQTVEAQQKLLEKQQEQIELLIEEVKSLKEK